MIRRVLFPLHTSSANLALGANSRFVNQSRAKKERKVVEQILSDRRFGRPERYVLPGVLNTYVVTFCRVSSGRLDKHDNLRLAGKHVIDSVAAFLGIDDRDPVVEWVYTQQRCEQGYAGVRITIEDRLPGPTIDLVLGGPGPQRLGPESEDGAGELPPKRKEQRAQIARGISPPVPHRAPLQPAGPQLPIKFGRAFVMLPWCQSGDGLPELDELALDPLTEPPSRITVPVPAIVRGLHAYSRNAILRLTARQVRLDRHRVRCAELGGEAVIYAERGAAELRYFAPKEAEAAE